MKFSLSGSFAAIALMVGASLFMESGASAQRTPPPDEKCFNEVRNGSLGIKMCESGSGIHSRGYVVVFRTDKSVTKFCKTSRSKRGGEWSHCDRFIANDMEVLYSNRGLRRDAHGVESLTVRPN